MKPYLLQLQKNFTQIKEVKHIKNFESKYAIRIYAMLKDSRLVNPLKIEIEKLAEILQLPKSYKDFFKINEKVLQVATQEINEKSDLKITKIEPIEKQRKKIIKIAIHFKTKEPTKEAQEQTKKARTAKQLEKYKGKTFMKFGALLKIDYVRYNETEKRYEAIYTNSYGEQVRSDFHSLPYLDKAIREAQEFCNEVKMNPKKYEPKKRDIKNLF